MNDHLQVSKWLRGYEQLRISHPAWGVMMRSAEWRKLPDGAILCADIYPSGWKVLIRARGLLGRVKEYREERWTLAQLLEATPDRLRHEIIRGHVARTADEEARIARKQAKYDQLIEELGEVEFDPTEFPEELAS